MIKNAYSFKTFENSFFLLLQQQGVVNDFFNMESIPYFAVLLNGAKGNPIHVRLKVD